MSSRDPSSAAIYQGRLLTTDPKSTTSASILRSHLGLTAIILCRRRKRLTEDIGGGTGGPVREASSERGSPSHDHQQGGVMRGRVAAPAHPAEGDGAVVDEAGGDGAAGALQHRHQVLQDRRRVRRHRVARLLQRHLACGGGLGV